MLDSETSELGSDAAATTVALLLGVPVDDVTMDEAIDRIAHLVGHGRRTDRTHQVATVNVDFLVNADSDAELATILRHASLSIPDGMPIVWGARLIGSPIRTRVAGADLVGELAARCARDGLTMSLFGAAPGVAERAAIHLQSRHPGLRVVGEAAPMFGRPDELAIDDLASLRSLKPDVCCVALGNPKQERFIARFGPELGIPVMIGVGGALDFLVGEQRRAPAWMQRSGIEWVHRAAVDPRRLVKRYARDAVVFIPRLVAQAWRGRRSRLRGVLRIERGVDGSVCVDLGALERADNRTACEIAAAVRHALAEGRPIEVRGMRDERVDTIPGAAELLADAIAAETAERKRSMRRDMRAMRRALVDRDQRSERLWAHVRGLPPILDASVVMAFDSVPGEPVTAAFVDWCRSQGKTVVLPEDQPPPDPALIDVVVVPGTAFSVDGHRLGQGGGWYDRFLTRLRPGCVTIGVCFAPQVVDVIPVETHDVALDLVISDEGVEGGRAQTSSS